MQSAMENSKPNNASIPAPLPPNVLDALARGWKIFPIAKGTKKECLTKWIHGGPGQEASNDLTQVEAWAETWPGCNWGLATGQASGVFIVDSDNPKGWKWASENGLTETRRVKSGSSTKQDAFHCYIEQPEGVKVKNSTGALHDGIDIRGDGGMVLLPGSLHPEGNFYTLVDDREPMKAPAFLIELVKKTEHDVDLSDLEPLTEAEKFYGLNVLRVECAKYADTPDGQWNNELNKLAFLAGRMVAAGVLTREEAEEKVSQSPTAAEYIAEDKRAFKRTFNSGFEGGEGKPWVPSLETPEEIFGAPVPKAAPMVRSLTVPDGTPNELTPEDFWAHLPSHKYINRYTRETYSADAINGHLSRFKLQLGMKPALWLDMFRAVHQMSWHPGYPEILEGMRSDNGVLKPEPTGRIFNRYRVPDAVGSEADASIWIDHIRKIYPTRRRLHHPMVCLSRSEPREED